MGLTIADIGAAPLAAFKVATPEWGAADAHVYVRAFPANELPKLQAALGDDSDDDDNDETLTPEKIRCVAAAVAMCLSDENGARICDDSKEHIDILASKPFPPLKRCLEAALEFNGLTEDAVEDAVKN